MQTRHIDRERYFLELAETSAEFYIDYLRKFKSLDRGSRILEIGCGEGGNLAPFAQMGCTVAGLDLAEGKIENARKFFAARGLDGRFFAADFLKTNPFEGEPLFDIILVHDVIEHIEPEGKTAFFERMKMYLKPGGIIFFGFPAWQMPFGGHQQICRSRICSKVPFVHILPAPIYRHWLTLFGEDNAKVEELLSIKRSMMTVESFERYCRDCGYSIQDRTLWLVSPHYKAKFHLRPRRLWKPLSRIPYLRNWFSTSCFYIIKVSDAGKTMTNFNLKG